MKDVLATDDQPVEAFDLGAWDVRVLAE